jgi:hypothetical protein
MSILTYVSGLFYGILCLLHPIHVTVTEIEYDEKAKALEIMMRVFTDDLESTIREKLNQPELDLQAPGNGKTTDQLIEDYLKDHFKISLDNKPQKLKYLGHEKESDALILYIEAPQVKKWKTIYVFNDILTDFHDDQSNLVHVNVRDDIKSLRLTRNTSGDKLTFDLK